MKNYAKIGNRNSMPAYRTQATFRYRKYLKITKTKIRNQKLRVKD